MPRKTRTRKPRYAVRAPPPAPKKKPIEQYRHDDKDRLNNPPVGLVDAKSEPAEGKKTYAYDPHLDPTLQWAGKAERTSFVLPTVSLHVHERIDPRSIVEAVRKKNGSNFEQLQAVNGHGGFGQWRSAVCFAPSDLPTILSGV